MAKVRINKLPPGYSVSNGRIVKPMQMGGFKTGTQRGYGLNTFPEFSPSGVNGDVPFFPSGGTTNNTLNPVPRDEANLEAEKGETALTDLNNDGSFELYNIAGNRHNSGGTPLNLPEQSFIFSDTRSMKLNKGELKELGIDSKKKMTPAKVSKKYNLNKFIGALDDPHSDKIATNTAEYMLDKNKKKLSHLAFVQEAKKGFDEGVPKAAFPYLKLKGIDPEEFALKIDQANAQLQQAQQGLEAPITDIETKQIFNKFHQATQPPPPQRPPIYGTRQGSTNPAGSGGIPGVAATGPTPMAQMGGNPFASNPLREFIYGGVPTYQGGDEVPSSRRTDLSENWESEEWNEFRNQFYQNYSEHMNLDELSDADKERLNTMFYEDMKQKGLLSEHYDDEYLNSEDWDTKYIRDADGNKIENENGEGYQNEVNWKYNRTIQDLKDNHDYEGDAMSESDIKEMQNFYIVMDQMSRDSQYGDMLEGTSFEASGVADEELGASGNISSADGYYGNTYNQQTVTTEHDKCPDAAAAEQACAAEGKPWIPYKEDGTGCQCGEAEEIEEAVQEIEEKDPEFWLQDQLGIINAVDNKFSLKKRYPIGTTYQENLIDPVFLDPTRQIAKIGEQAAIAADTASTFAGPQRAAAVQAKAQGVAADQIADAMANVDNQNAKIANDVSTKNAEIKMRTQQANKKELSNLYDKTMLVEENYDNALRGANEQITKQLQNAYTNRAKTHNLNMTYPQFDIDPSTGGIIDITDPKAFYPSKENQDDLLEQKLGVLEELEPYMGEDGISDATTLDILNSTTGTQQTQVSPYADIIANQSMYPGGGLNTTPLTQTLPTQAYGSETPFIPIVRFGLERPKRKLVKRNTY